MKAKNGSDNKKIDTFTLKYSSDCEKCNAICNNGKAYLQRINEGGRFGMGVVCKKI